MNTKLLMTSSAFVMGATGLVLTFLPEELSNYYSFGDRMVILLQLTGALYFGFAILNWTAKGNIIGGIYSKPIAVGNFTHFLIGGLALLKLAMRDKDIAGYWIAAALYLIFAFLFGYVSFTNPAGKSKPA